MTLCSSWNCKCRFTMKTEKQLRNASWYFKWLKAMHTCAWVNLDSTKSIQDHWLHCVQQVHWNQWVNWVGGVHPRSTALVPLIQPLIGSTGFTRSNRMRSTINQFYQFCQVYVQAFYIVNDFLNLIIETQRTMLKMTVFLNGYSVILVLYDSR